MRYLVTHPVTIEAESARQNHVELLYTVER